MMSALARRVAVGQVIACALAVGFMVFAMFYFNHDAVAKRAMDGMAKDYYENYFYERFLAGREVSFKVFEKYAERGFPEVNLQYLLNFDGARNAEQAGDFYRCDRKTTTAKIIPVKPFGLKDYTLETELDCGH